MQWKVVKTWVNLEVPSAPTLLTIGSGRDLSVEAIDALVEKARQRALREPEPTACRIEVKTASYEEEIDAKPVPVGEEPESVVTESSVFHEVTA